MDLQVTVCYSDFSSSKKGSYGPNQSPVLPKEEEEYREASSEFEGTWQLLKEYT
jgi:hypothetical protein